MLGPEVSQNYNQIQVKVNSEKSIIVESVVSQSEKLVLRKNDIPNTLYLFGETLQDEVAATVRSE